MGRQAKKHLNAIGRIKRSASARLPQSSARSVISSTNRHKLVQPSFLIKCFAGVFSLLLLYWLPAWFSDYPLEEVELQAPFIQVSHQEVRSQLTNLLPTGYFSLDLDQVKKSIETIEWVEKVQVERHWPARLWIRISEKRAVARWNHEALVSDQGERFTPDFIPAELESLPMIKGQDFEFVALMRQYFEWASMLVSVDLELLHLESIDGIFWQLNLTDHVQLVVDKQNSAAKIKRFVAAYPSLIADPRGLARVDLRYSNGLAVAWRENDDMKP